MRKVTVTVNPCVRCQSCYFQRNFFLTSFFQVHFYFFLFSQIRNLNKRSTGTECIQLNIEEKMKEVRSSSQSLSVSVKGQRDESILGRVHIRLIRAIQRQNAPKKNENKRSSEEHCTNELAIESLHKMFVALEKKILNLKQIVLKNNNNLNEVWPILRINVVLILLWHAGGISNSAAYNA